MTIEPSLQTGQVYYQRVKFTTIVSSLLTWCQVYQFSLNFSLRCSWFRPGIYKAEGADCAVQRADEMDFDKSYLASQPQRNTWWNPVDGIVIMAD